MNLALRPPQPLPALFDSPLIPAEGRLAFCRGLFLIVRNIRADFGISTSPTGSTASLCLSLGGIKTRFLSGS